MINRVGVNDSLLSEIVRRVLRVARPNRIILFGSAATGQMTKDSDIELLIVAPTLKNRHEERLRIADAIGDIEYPVDVIMIAPERFEATKDIIGGIAYPAHKYGRVLYEAAVREVLEGAPYPAPDGVPENARHSAPSASVAAGRANTRRCS